MQSSVDQKRRCGRVVDNSRKPGDHGDPFSKPASGSAVEIFPGRVGPYHSSHAVRTASTAPIHEYSPRNRMRHHDGECLQAARKASQIKRLAERKSCRRDPLEKKISTTWAREIHVYLLLIRDVCVVWSHKGQWKISSSFVGLFNSIDCMGEREKECGAARDPSGGASRKRFSSSLPD